MSENLENLILAVPVIGVLLFFLNYFIKGYESEKQTNASRDKDDADVIRGLSDHVKDNNKRLETSEKKLDEIIRKIEK